MMLKFEAIGLKETLDKIDKYQKSVDDKLQIFFDKLLDFLFQNGSSPS